MSHHPNNNDKNNNNTHHQQQQQKLEIMTGLDIAQDPDLNKIIQWYCCQCANSHGDVEEYMVYKLQGGGYYLRNDCSRCNHLMCPYCTKGRWGHYLNAERNGTNI